MMEIYPFHSYLFMFCSCRVQLKKKNLGLQGRLTTLPLPNLPSFPSSSVVRTRDRRTTSVAGVA